MAVNIKPLKKGTFQGYVVEGDNFKEHPGSKNQVCYYDIIGNNNKLIIEDDAQLNNFRVEFCGNCENATVRICAGARVRGVFSVSSNCVIIIGRKVVMARPSQLVARENTFIKVGAGCLISNVLITTTDQHGIYDKETKLRINPSLNITIGDKVWLAASVSVFKGVNIGHDTVIGANSIVTKDIGAHSIAIGTPAKVVREGVVWSQELREKY